jgi:hypothetical protein
MCKPDPGPCRLRPVPLGRVAEWQTRTVQVRVSVRTWGFNSPLAHTVRCSVALRATFPSSFPVLGATPQTPRCELLRTRRGCLPIDRHRSLGALAASLPCFLLCDGWGLAWVARFSLSVWCSPKRRALDGRLVLSWRIGHESCHFLANGNWQRKVGAAGGALWLMAGFARLVALDQHPFVVGRAGERGRWAAFRSCCGLNGISPRFVCPPGLVHCSIRGTLVRQEVLPRSSPDPGDHKRSLWWWRWIAQCNCRRHGAFNHPADDSPRRRHSRAEVSMPSVDRSPTARRRRSQQTRSCLRSDQVQLVRQTCTNKRRVRQGMA